MIPVSKITAQPERDPLHARIRAWLKQLMTFDAETLAASAVAISAFYGAPIAYIPNEPQQREAGDNDDGVTAQQSRAAELR